LLLAAAKQFPMHSTNPAQHSPTQNIPGHPSRNQPPGFAGPFYWQPPLANNNTQPLKHGIIVHVQLLFTTVVPLLNQGTIRHRGVSDSGVFFGYFLDKQKVTMKTVRSTNNLQSLQPFNR